MAQMSASHWLRAFCLTIMRRRMSIRGQQLSSTGLLRLLPANLFIVAHHGTNVCKPLVESFLPNDYEEKNVYTQPLLTRRCPVKDLQLGSHTTGHLQSLSGLCGFSRSPAF